MGILECFFDQAEPTKKAKDECKGKIFRCNDSQFSYQDKRGRTVFGQKTYMTELKKESCPGCENCGYLIDDLHEFSCEKDVDIRPNVEHGAKYSLKIVDIGIDRESGIADEWHIAFVKIKDKT